jgi:phosphoenolpyruvate carboxylase
MKQNVPGYFGLGSALEALAGEGMQARVKTLYARNLFFRTLLDNAMQSLSKTSFRLTSYLSEDPEFGEFWHILHNEAKRTIAGVLEVSGQSELLEVEPSTKQSIRMREEIVTPALVIQQYALNATANPAVRVAEESPKTLERMITKSLAAAVNASRNAV